MATTVVDSGGNLSPAVRSFRPTSAPAVTAVTGTAAAVTLNETLSRPRQTRWVNNGTQVVYFTLNGTTATTANGHPILPNTVETFLVAPSDVISVIASTTGSTLTISVGEGS